MATVDLDRVASLVRSWRAFEQTRAETAKELRALIQNACEALTTNHDHERMLASEPVRMLRHAVSAHAPQLGFNSQSDLEFLFWATSLCLRLTAA